jgi:hypothetical protein
MKADSQAYSNFYTSLVLKFAGLVIILGSLVDFVVLAIPGDFLNGEWTAQLISDWIDRGSVPMLGLALVFISVWLDRTVGIDGGRSSKLLKPSLILAFLLSVTFFISAPLYFSSSRTASATATRTVNSQAATTERQLDAQLEERRALVKAILSDSDRRAVLDKEVNNPTLDPAEREELQQLKRIVDNVEKDPTLLDKEIEEARKVAKETLDAQLKSFKGQVSGTTQQNRIRIILSSVILSLGYFAIGWTGFVPSGEGKKGVRSPKVKQMKQVKPKRKRK